MLRQNIKGLLTLIFIFTLLVGGFYVYKTVLEPSFISKGVDQLPLTTDVEISPEIMVYANTATITWKTPFESLGGVMYCEKDNPKVCKEVSSDSKKTEQKIDLQNLTPETSYNYKIIVDGQYFPEGEDKFFEFLTTKQESKTTPNQKSPLTRETPANTSTTTAVKAKNLLELKKAIEKQDLNYDVNGDGKINLADYQP